MGGSTGHKSNLQNNVERATWRPSGRPARDAPLRLPDHDAPRIIENKKLDGALHSQSHAVCAAYSDLVGRVSDGGERRVLVADLVHGGEEGELVLEPLHLEDVVHLLGGEGALQLLAAEELRLDGVERLGLVGRRESLRALAVAPTVAHRDEIGHAARLEEGLVLDTAVGVEHLAELDHLVEANADDRGLGVAAMAETVAEARTDGDNVLERATQLHTDGVLDSTHLERGVVVGQLEESAVSLVLVADGGLAEGIRRHVVGNLRGSGGGGGGGGGGGRRASEEEAKQAHERRRRPTRLIHGTRTGTLLRSCRKAAAVLLV